MLGVRCPFLPKKNGRSALSWFLIRSAQARLESGHIVRTIIFSILPAILLSTACVAQADEYLLTTFEKIQLTDKFWSDAATFGDINRDGHHDIVSGPFWYEGPAFKTRHAYYPATHTFQLKKPDGSEETLEGHEGALGSGKVVTGGESIFVKVVDLNEDSWPDILSVSYPFALEDLPRTPAWYENPGAHVGSSDAPWKRHVFSDQVDNQSLELVDLFDTGKPVLIAMAGGKSGAAGGRAGYFVPDSKHPTQPWGFHPISWPVDEFQWYTHGLGYGDLNGDGRNDILHSDGWWEQPPSLEGDPVWPYRAYPFSLGPGQIKQNGYRGPGDPLRVAILADMSADGIPSPVTIYGGSHMHVDDVNGDGLADVVTSITAHGYGLAWWEQLQERDSYGAPVFKRHLIINKRPHENKYGVKFTEMQAVAYVDIDGDGLKDIVTGKRFWGHGSCCLDPESNEPAVLYWFKQARQGGEVEFIPYLIDGDSGAGTQITIGDVNRDSRPDIVVANTKGAFVFLQQVKRVGKTEWRQAQPRPR